MIMKRLFEFTFAHKPETSVIIPEGAIIVDIRYDGYDIAVMAVADPTRPAVERAFIVALPGSYVPSRWIYIGKIEYKEWTPLGLFSDGLGSKPVTEYVFEILEDKV